MCKYCQQLNGCDEPLPNINKENSSILLDRYEDMAYIEIDYEESFGYTSMYYRDRIYINFCPICGRKLEK